MHGIAGMEKKDGVPVLAKVAAIFWQITAGFAQTGDDDLAAATPASVPRRARSFGRGDR